MAGRRTGLILASGLVALLLCSTIWLLFANSSERKKAGNSSQQEVESLKAEIAALREEQRQLGRGVGLSISRLSQRNASPVPNSGQATEPDSPPALPTHQDSEVVAAQIEQRRAAERQATLASKKMMADLLASEAPDPSWAPSATRILDKVYTDAQLPPMKHKTRCGSTLCSVELEVDKPARAGDAMKYLASQAGLPWPGQAFFDVDPNGKGTFYYGRDGHELPHAEVQPSP